MARAHALRPLHARALEIIHDPPATAVAGAAEHHFTGQGGQPRATVWIMDGAGGHVKGDGDRLQAGQILAENHDAVVERRRMEGLFRHQADRLSSRGNQRTAGSARPASSSAAASTAAPAVCGAAFAAALAWERSTVL